MSGDFTNMDLHYKKENEILEQLLKLEDEFRDHYEFHVKESEKQLVIFDRVWLLTQRYLIICNPVCSKNAAFYPNATEDAILQEYNEKLRMLRSSNCQILQSISKLNPSCRKFEELCSELDMTKETPFILGDHFHKPIAYFIELVSDLFKYLHALALKMKYFAQLIEPNDLNMLEEYKKLLKPNEDFCEYLHMGLEYCRCLRPKLQCPPNERWRPCWKM